MKASIIIPLYNKEKYIWECIESVQNQTYKGEIEICIHDDCSTDNSLEVAKKCVSEIFTRGEATFTKGAMNGGTAYASNRAEASATGDVIFLLGADDLCHPQRVERQIKMLTETNATIVDSYLVYEGVKKNYLVKPHTPDAKRAMAASGKNPMNGGTMAWKKELRKLMEAKDGYFFNEKLRHAEDVEFAMRAVKYVNAYSCPHILYTARRNADNKTAWADRGDQVPKRRKEDLKAIEAVRVKLYGRGIKRKGVFL